MRFRLIFRGIVGQLLAGIFVVAAAAQSNIPFRCSQSSAQDSESKKNIVIDGVRFADGDDVPAEAKDAIVAAMKGLRVADVVRWVDDVQEVKVRGALQDDGYFEANPDVRAQFLREQAGEKHFALAIRLDEAGRKQFRLLQIRFVPAKQGEALIFSEDELRRNFEINDGDLFDVAKTRIGIEKLTKAYGARGYIDFTATPDFEIDHAKQTILLTMTLDSQKQYRIKSVEVLGLDSAAESALRQRIVPGEIFDNASAEAAFEDVYEANKAVLPAIPPREFSFVAKDVKNGTLVLTADFRACPEIASELAQAENARPLPVRDGIQVDEIQDLKIIKVVNPIWPAAAYRDQIFGDVQLRVTVGRDGSVADVKVLGGPTELIPAAVEAVRKSQFDPSSARPVTETIRIVRVKN